MSRASPCSVESSTPTVLRMQAGLGVRRQGNGVGAPRKSEEARRGRTTWLAVQRVPAPAGLGMWSAMACVRAIARVWLAWGLMASCPRRMTLALEATWRSRAVGTHRAAVGWCGI